VLHLRKCPGTCRWLQAGVFAVWSNLLRHWIEKVERFKKTGRDGILKLPETTFLCFAWTALKKSKVFLNGFCLKVTVKTNLKHLQFIVYKIIKQALKFFIYRHYQ